MGGLAALFTRNLIRSRTGRAYLAIREKDVAAGMLGIRVTRYKLSAFVISGVFAGVADEPIAAASSVSSLDPRSST